VATVEFKVDLEAISQAVQRVQTVQIEREAAKVRQRRNQGMVVESDTPLTMRRAYSIIIDNTKIYVVRGSFMLRHMVERLIASGHQAKVRGLVLGLDGRDTTKEYLWYPTKEFNRIQVGPGLHLQYLTNRNIWRVTFDQNKSVMENVMRMSSKNHPKANTSESVNDFISAYEFVSRISTIVDLDIPDGEKKKLAIAIHDSYSPYHGGSFTPIEKKFAESQAENIELKKLVSGYQEFISSYGSRVNRLG
jgi:hypothetical protein